MDKRVIAIAFTLSLPFPLWAQLAPPPGVPRVIPQPQILQQAEERQQAILEQQLSPPSGPEVIEYSLPEPSAIPPSEESGSCFVIEQVFVGAGDFPFFRKYVIQALEHPVSVTEKEDVWQVDDNAPWCVHLSDLNEILNRAQNRLIDAGWVTTRVLLPDQDLTSGRLEIEVIPGLLNEIQLDTQESEKTHIDRLTTANALPLSKGKPINLRDIEQGLDNLRRLPTVSASIDIEPGSAPGSSDLRIQWAQRTIPVRLSLMADDSGSKATGKYQMSAVASWDNPLHLNDIFVASYSRNFLPADEVNSPGGDRDRGESNNYYFNYSVPFGYWQLDLGTSHYYYDQIVAGQTRNYHYSGKSTQYNADLSRLAYRNNQHKINLSAGLWAKRNESFIDDVALDVQERKTGGWRAGVSTVSYFNAGTLQTAINYKRGTGAFNAQPAPEEAFNEGSSRMRIWTTDINWDMPIYLAEETFSWNSQFHGQWAENRLTSQDRLTIGGRYSVRGFSGEASLSGDNGWYWRNNLAWHYQPAHQLYLGVDAGHVSGPFTDLLPGKTLSGAALGTKGELKWNGRWYYDLFVSRPLTAPDHFPTDNWVSGFNVGYNW